MSRSHWSAVLVALLLVPGTSARDRSPPSGALEGWVRDRNGQGIGSAQVRVEGTPLGAVADSSGFYRIASIPPGQVSVAARFVGYRPVRVVGLQILADSTVRLDFALDQVSVELVEIETLAAENVLVPRDVVVNRQGGIEIRPEAAAYISGVPVTAGQRGSGFIGEAGISTSAFEEASVTTGAASAVFGHAQAGVISGGYTDPRARQPNTEEYNPLYESRFLAAATNPLSTFGIDVDAAAYANVRRFLSEGQVPPPDAVRIEELVNYFTYPYPDPAGPHPFSVTLEEGACPWNADHRLVLVGLQGRRMETASLPPSNLVFLIDVSGSMGEPNKLPLVQRAFRLLVRHLRPVDRVAIVVYAGAAGLVLPSTSGGDHATILEAIDRLEAGGSTAGGEGIRLAYQVAREQFQPEGNNRVILATDGDFNVGASSEADLVRIIETERASGVFLTVLGFGTGNLKDARMEQLADKGNGQYAYVDDYSEARRVFVNQMAGTLHVIAKDVKLQLEFNPARVRAYRLIGYENRVLAKEDFDDDRKDAGDLGAGHSVTALYEVVPAGTRDLATGTGDGLRYQTIALTDQARTSREWLTVKLRYKAPRDSTSRLLTRSLREQDVGRPPSETLGFASAVVEFGLLLRNSEYRGTASAEAVLARARANLGPDPGGYRAEFLRLVAEYRELGAVSSRQ